MQEKTQKQSLVQEKTERKSIMNISRDRTFQLIYQSCYFALSVVAVLGSVGFFAHTFVWSFYIHFTNLSNYFCTAIMLAELIQTARKKEDSYVSFHPCLKFVGMLGIFLTFMVFNFLLANQPGRDPAKNFVVECVLMHMVLPVLYIGDWVLFYEHRKVKWYDPIASTLLPIAYLAFIFLHAWAYHFDTGILNYSGDGPLIYPYFFLNPETQGVGGVVKWFFILMAGFMVTGYAFLGIDRILPHRGKKEDAA